MFVKLIGKHPIVTAFWIVSTIFIGGLGYTVGKDFNLALAIFIAFGSMNSSLFFLIIVLLDIYDMKKNGY